MQQYTNIAFISYKREDEKWAKWLQKKLEHYKLPTEIRKQNPDLEFAKNPRHVFKDTTDLSGGVLAKAIKEGLDSSKFLIVICSPRAAKSPWVCKEVQEFIDSGREEYIIPFIIDGEPYAKNSDNECFPDALKALSDERELLGININENGRVSAAVKVVARLFDLRFDILWNRFQREEKRRRQYMLGAFVSAIFILLAIIGYGSWSYLKIQSQQDEIIHQRDRARFANKKLLIANDSIIKQKSALQKAYDNLTRTKQSLAQSNADLKESNKRLKEEKDNVVRTNREMRISRSKAVARKSLQDIAAGNTLKSMTALLEVAFENEKENLYVSEVENALRIAYDSLFSMRSYKNIDVARDSWLTKSGKYLLSVESDERYSLYDIDDFAYIGSMPFSYADLVYANENETKFAILGEESLIIYDFPSMRVLETYFYEKENKPWIHLKGFNLVTKQMAHNFSFYSLLREYIKNNGYDGALDYNGNTNMMLLYKKDGDGRVRVSLIDELTGGVLWESGSLKANAVNSDRAFVFSASGNLFSYFECTDDECVLHVINTKTFIDTRINISHEYFNHYCSIDDDERFVHIYSYSYRVESSPMYFSLSDEHMYFDIHKVLSENKPYIHEEKLFYKKRLINPDFMDYSPDSWDFDFNKWILTINGEPISATFVGPTLKNFPIEESLVVKNMYLAYKDGALACFDKKDKSVIWYFMDDEKRDYCLWTGTAFSDKYIFLETHDAFYDKNTCFLVEASTGMVIRKWENTEDIFIDDNNYIYTSSGIFETKDVKAKTKLYRSKFFSYQELLQKCKKEVKNIELTKKERMYYNLE